MLPKNRILKWPFSTQTFAVNVVANVINSHEKQKFANFFCEDAFKVLIKSLRNTKVVILPVSLENKKSFISGRDKRSFFQPIHLNVHWYFGIVNK